MEDRFVEVVVWAALSAWVAWLVYRRSVRGVEERARNHAVVERILDRFASADELLAFVRSDEGKQLLYGRAGTANPRRSVIRFVQVGIVVFSLGVAFLANAIRLAGETDINFIRKVEDLRYWGTAGVSVGAGLLVVAAVSHLMARRWGLLDGRETRP
ncbi:MAG TPA: hypothetical protein VFK57_12640 [Vicinamibacterales bacterium]|nr:hypothetical protein [Vicinamibacterales bacterium]